MLTISDRIDDLFPTPNIFNQTAKDLGISPDQLEAKIDGKDDFLQSEIKAIAKRYNIQLDGAFKFEPGQDNSYKITTLTGEEAARIWSGTLPED